MNALCRALDVVNSPGWENANNENDRSITRHKLASVARKTLHRGVGDQCGVKLKEMGHNSAVIPVFV